MAVTAQPTRVADVDLDLKFPTLVVGIGCRRGTPRETIKRLLVTVFHEKQWSLAAVRKLVSVAQKKDEAGLIDLARELRVPLACYSVRQLAAVLRDRPSIEQSAFVAEKIGVGAVCEPAAIWGSQGGKLLVEKRQSQGVTLAVARVALP